MNTTYVTPQEQDKRHIADAYARKMRTFDDARMLEKLRAEPRKTR